MFAGLKVNVEGRFIEGLSKYQYSFIPFFCFHCSSFHKPFNLQQPLCLLQEQKHVFFELFFFFGHSGFSSCCFNVQQLDENPGTDGLWFLNSLKPLFLWAPCIERVADFCTALNDFPRREVLSVRCCFTLFSFILPSLLICSLLWGGALFPALFYTVIPFILLLPGDGNRREQ